MCGQLVAFERGGELYPGRFTRGGERRASLTLVVLPGVEREIHCMAEQVEFLREAALAHRTAGAAARAEAFAWETLDHRKQGAGALVKAVPVVLKPASQVLPIMPCGVVVWSLSPCVHLHASMPTT